MKHTQNETTYQIDLKSRWLKRLKPILQSVLTKFSFSLLSPV